MNGDNGMKRLCDGYVRNINLIGALYCIVPVAVWFAWMFAVLPFRGVYVLRLILSLAVGVPLAVAANRFCVGMWLIKHRSAEGPATVFDGVMIGVLAGIGTVLAPPLTGLIATNHVEEAKWFIIICWLIGMAVGAINGGVLASIGRAHIERGPAKKVE